MQNQCAEGAIFLFSAKSLSPVRAVLSGKCLVRLLPGLFGFHPMAVVVGGAIGSPSLQVTEVFQANGCAM